MMALSSLEVEYVDTALTTKEDLWLQNIIKKLDIIKLYKNILNNASCIKIALNPELIN